MRKLKLVFACLLTLLLVACGKTMEEKWQEKYDLGMRYLTEGSYEEAILAFTTAIKIDEIRVDGYFGLSDAYIGAGDFENAKATLEKGYELTQDEVFREKLDSLFENHLAMFLSDDPVDVDDFLIGGKPVTECTLAEFMAAYPSKEDRLLGGTGIYEQEGELEYRPRLESDSGSSSSGNILADARGYNEQLTRVDFYHNSHLSVISDWELPYKQIDFKTIGLCDSISSVLMKMGFNDEGREYILDCLREHKGVHVNVSEELQYSTREFDGSDGAQYYAVDIWRKGGGINLDFRNDELYLVQYVSYE